MHKDPHTISFSPSSRHRDSSQRPSLAGLACSSPSGGRPCSGPVVEPSLPSLRIPKKSFRLCSYGPGRESLLRSVAPSPHRDEVAAATLPRAHKPSHRHTQSCTSLPAKGVYGDARPHMHKTEPYFVKRSPAFATSREQDCSSGLANPLGRAELGQIGVRPPRADRARQNILRCLQRGGQKARSANEKEGKEEEGRWMRKPETDMKVKTGRAPRRRQRTHHWQRAKDARTEEPETEERDGDTRAHTQKHVFLAAEQRSPPATPRPRRPPERARRRRRRDRRRLPPTPWQLREAAWRGTM